MTDASREFHFTHDDFERVRKMIYDYAGIALHDGKQDMVYGRLARRLRALNLSSFKDYLAYLQRGDQKEWEAFVNSLTTNLTSFFREDHHFAILLEHLKKRSGGGQVSIWCSAASTGEEPYSIAMTVCEAFDSLTPPAKIIATDLDTNVLDFGSKGVYPQDRSDKISPARAARFFTKGADGSLLVKPELKNLITFRRLNLIDSTWPIRGPFDAIFCRNVMIYFDKPTQVSILKKFVPLMRQDGLLFVGHSENFYHAADLFRLRGKTVYELASTANARID
ncbi:chemotaxis protein methyltransferase CheR [Chitinivorax tropicus]|uniref:Chemotaxis protein methyltransferase n=1 Tax=Chitinivorax tropicus TaxID=714531 RepID=A0A840MPZ9_9PROT|nr:CheR family methyltransferase [Chitinivorax tropicus]MBB5018546.1 chemotaxis protein methyltransferase CheR [Chitinivorax tropicus]